MAEAALQNFKGDISKCVDVLTNNPEQISQIMEDKSKEYEKTEEARKRMEEDLGNEEGNQYYLTELLCMVKMMLPPKNHEI